MTCHSPRDQPVSLVSGNRSNLTGAPVNAEGDQREEKRRTTAGDDTTATWAGRRLRQLDRENERLKRLVAELSPTTGCSRILSREKFDGSASPRNGGEAHDAARRFGEASVPLGGSAACNVALSHASGPRYGTAAPPGGACGRAPALRLRRCFDAKAGP